MKSHSSVGSETSDTSMSVSALADTEELIHQEGTTDLSRSDLEVRKRKGLKKEFERKQLLHDLQVLRIELSQKSLVIDNLKEQHMNRVEDLEEKLHEVIHKKQLLQARLESALAIQQDDSKKRQHQTEKELKIILDRQRELEQTNRRLQAKGSNIKNQLRKDCHVSEEVYVELKAQQESDLTIGDYFVIRLYESIQPLQIECTNLRSQRDKLSANIAQTSHSLQSYQQELMQERRFRSQAEVQLEAAELELGSVRKQLGEREGKAQRFDSVDQERGRLSHAHNELQEKHSYLLAEYNSTAKELEALKKEFASSQQSLQLYKQDKEYLTKNLFECSTKLENSEDALRRTQDQLEAAKKAREDLYEKYTSSRDEARSSYEHRLQTELDRIRLQTEKELEKLRSDSKASFERENKSLRESRDLAAQERDQLAKLRDDAEKRCENYSAEIRALESAIDARLSDHQNEARTKTFEFDRLQLIHEETTKNLHSLQTSNERLSRKLEVVTFEHSDLLRRSSANEAQLETTARDLKSRLTAYEKLESEMDDIVMQAAEVGGGGAEVGGGVGGGGVGGEAERVLFSYGYGANVPTTSKRRMQQSVHLARRILQLEKINSGLHKEIQQKEEDFKATTERLRKSERLLEESSQPRSYLIESARRRQEELERSGRRVGEQEERIAGLEVQVKKLKQTKRAMSRDLERLLGHREDVAVIKQLLSPRSEDKRRPHSEDKRGRCHGDEDSPDPIVFTKVGGKTGFGG